MREGTVSFRWFFHPRYWRDLRVWFYRGGGCLEDGEWVLCLGPLVVRHDFV